ncbi:Fic family protein [Leptotrichia shahii]|uniref:Fic family protein n=1 Tax=Leptotrichia shahii TaxID=157691 RepID=UPI0028D5083E|nr:Fic family protein [Leptotrichia shahii]
MFYNTYLKKGLNKMVEIFKEFLNKERPLNDGILRKLQNNLRTEFIYNSNAIEGNTLTLRETDIILQFGITVKGKSLKEHNEVKGQEYALDFLNEVLKKEESLSIRLIREFHALILNDDKDNRGRFKQENNTILGAKFQTTPFYQVEEKLQELIDNFNESDKNLIEKVAKFHNDFEMVHPFNDGNGRTGRLLMNLELMKNGYPITIIKNEDRDDYYQALEIASIDKNYIPLTEFIKRSVENTFWIYYKHFNEETKEKFENYLKKNEIEIEKFYKEWIDRKPEILIDLPRNWYDKIKVQTTKK